MRRVRGKNSKPELLVRSHLHTNGFRFRLHNRKLPGTPDIVLPRYRTVILVHGCFWHRHENCRYTTTPSTNTQFWVDKFKRNVERDKENIKALNDAGYEVFVLWECELKTMKALAELVDSLDGKRREFRLKESVVSESCRVVNGSSHACDTRVV